MVVVALVHELVCANDKVKAVVLQELVARAPPEDPAGSAAVPVPSLFAIVWVTPTHIRDRSYLRDLASALDRGKLFDHFNLWGETAMYTVDLVTNQSSHWKHIHSLIAHLPKTGMTIALDDFVVKTI